MAFHVNIYGAKTGRVIWDAVPSCDLAKKNEYFIRKTIFTPLYRLAIGDGRSNGNFPSFSRRPLHLSHGLLPPRLKLRPSHLRHYR